MKSLPHIVYLHGFLSSPVSLKARQTAAWMQEKGLAEWFHCPELLTTPHDVGDQLRALYESLKGERVCTIGSSLGGFYATWAVEEFGGRAVLINPAVRPYDLLQNYIGEQRNYQTGAVQMVDASFADDLRCYERTVTKPLNYWLLVQTGDETLDYRDAVQYYAGSRQSIVAGGNHSFVDFHEILPLAWEFAQEGD